MFSDREKGSQHRKYIFSITIEYGDIMFEQRSKTSKSNTERKDDYYLWEVGEKIINIVENDLPRDLKERFGLETKINKVATYNGSLIILFNVILGTYYFIANYNKFCESVKLIKKQCNRLISKFLRDEHENNLIYSIEDEYPDVTMRDRCVFVERSYRTTDIAQLIGNDTNIVENAEKSRDGNSFILLLYLIITNLLLVSVVGFLVYNAVKKVYFQ